LRISIDCAAVADGLESAGVEEPDICRLRIIEQAQRAASELGRGRDGMCWVPPEIKQHAADWKQKLDSSDRTLDEEEWLIGLLTLACLRPTAASKVPSR